MLASTAGISNLPALYAPWIAELLGGPLPSERHATCSACTMCKPGAETAPTRSLREFDPGTKCCTYVPTLPNFLVGLVLEGDDPAASAGRSSIERRIAEGTNATPLGLQADPRFALIYKHAGSALFGQTSGLRCPHYLPDGGGACGIWRHRNAVCATWFCKHERGRVGKQFWDALLRLLMLAERHLSLWAAAELGESPRGLGAALLPYFATTFDASPHNWSDRWADQPQEFYRATGRLVQPLTWSRVSEIGGAELALAVGRLRVAYAALQTDDVPEYLRLGAVARVRVDGSNVALTGYNDQDMAIVPFALADALDQFDGRHTTRQVCAALTAELGAPIDAATVRRWVDYGVLVPMPTSEKPVQC